MRCSSPTRARRTARWKLRASWVAGSLSASTARSGEFKNWAIPQAAHEWVFILDADERITPELAAEIRGELVEPRHDGYWIYRRNHFMGHPIRFGPWKNDRCLRLFRRDLGRYVGPTDHAEVELSQRHGWLVCASGSRITRATRIHSISQNSLATPMCKPASGTPRGDARSCGHLLLRFPLRFLHGYVVATGFFGWTRRPASVRAGGVPVVVEAGVSVAIAKWQRSAGDRSK